MIDRDDKKSFVSTSQISNEWEKNGQGEHEVDRNSLLYSKHLPESFAVHVLLSDATVGESLVPHRIQRVSNSLGFQFIGL